MQMAPLISVIIPTYNRKNLAEMAIRSVLDQTFQDFEVILVDDGSTDATSGLQQMSRKLRYFFQENKGVAAARNLGISYARGEWLAFLDSDDRWLPRKLEEQLLFHEKSPQLDISQTQEIWIRRGVRVNPMKKHSKPEGSIFEASLSLCLVSPSCVMMRKDLIETVGLFDESFPVCEDYELWLRISARFAVGLLDKALTVKCGGHADQLSKRYWGMDRFRIRAIVKTLDGTSLSEKQRKACFAELQKKCRIYAEGCSKRGHPDEAKVYLELAEKYSGTD